MNKLKTELGFVDSDERLTKLSSLLEIVEAKHVGDVCVARAKAMVDAALLLNVVNYDVMDVVVKSLEQSGDYSLDVFDAHELAFDILADMPIGYRINSPEEHLSPTDEIALTRETVQAVVHEMADEGLLADGGNGVFHITKAGREYAHQLEKAQNGNDNPIPAFDNTLVTGDVKYGGDGHRCVDIARECLARGLWDGQSKLHVCGDVHDMHKRMMFNNHNPYICGLDGYPGQAFCYMNLGDLPHDTHITVPPFALADDDTQELPALTDDGICVHCSLFTATHGNLCSVCVDFQEVDNGD